jgi:hypothetical protein
MDIELTTSLVTCPECHIIFQYYDFLSHSDLCYYTNYESIHESINETIHETTNETMELDTEMNSILEPHIPMTTRLSRLNGLNDYGNYGNYGNTNTINLYNPMINRGFHNSNSYSNDNSDDVIYTLNNYLLSLTINNSNTTINNGLNKKELENYSKIIECSDSTDCHICLCNYPKYTHFYLMNCNHSFCIECCERWFSTNSLCPLCRKNYK